MDTSKIKYIVLGVVGLVALIMANPVAFVGTGQRGVVTHFGKVQNETLDEGVHLVTPFVTSVHTLSVRVKKNGFKTQASSKDLQLITAEFAINWHIDASKVNSVYQTLGGIDAVLDNVLTPAISEAFKASAATKTAEEIITKRSELADQSAVALRDRLNKYGVIVDDISITDLDFTTEFAHAVEQKQIAEQDAKRAHYVAQKATQEANAEIEKAKGQAEAQRLMKSTITPEILKKMMIEKWDGKFPKYVGGGSSNLLLQLPSEK